MWGLGTVLYEAATGEPAFDADDGSGSWTDDTGRRTPGTRRSSSGGLPAARRAARPRAGVPDALAAAIAACLAPDPADRPTLPELAAALVPLAPGARPWDGVAARSPSCCVAALALALLAARGRPARRPRRTRARGRRSPSRARSCPARLVDVRRDRDNGKWEVTMRQGERDYEVELAPDDLALLRVDYD